MIPRKYLVSGLIGKAVSTRQRPWHRMPPDSIGIASTSQSDAKSASHRVRGPGRDAMLRLPALGIFAQVLRLLQEEHKGTARDREHFGA